MDGDEARDLFQAQSHLYKHIFNFISSMSLKCAVQLGIPDIINSHGQPITLPDLVTALQIHPARTGHVHRLMRLMVRSGFFAIKQVRNNQEEEEEEEAYDLTPSSRLLLKDRVPSLSPFVLAMLDPALATPWQFLGNWFRGNELTPFESAHGMGFWEYGDQNPEFNGLFNEAMTSDSGMMNLVIKDCKPIFEGLSSLVDVGGGTGKVARILCEAFPHLKCTVLELPQVVANLADTENLKFIGGDMFQAIPPADAILLKLTLHALSDEECLKVLKKCREAIPGNGQGKVIIIDIVIDDTKDEDEITEAKLFFDMLMMVVVTGRERSEKDWKNLFLEAGFSNYKLTPIFGLRYLHLPHTTVIGFENNDKRAWVERIMQVDKRDIGTALNVISSNISAATFLCSISLTLSSLIGAWLGSSSSNEVFTSELIYGNVSPSILTIKYITLLTCFLLAFACFVQSARHFVHANYLISTPDSNIPAWYVELAVIRGGDFWSLGLRALYFALTLLLWFFGPIPMFLSSIVLVILLHYMDKNTRPLHDHQLPGRQLVKNVGQRITEVAVNIHQHTETVETAV
ncbi:PREDICTED: trans-resveratrol [Prunus dulcis]|uniref:PREDICTED: trans-resveratrol n=1 Tax=Prunus dulcis TaxID=3755 RepID=A0A5E4F9B4_PRUDU|nr:hypothetical protein L3X38_021376 [Prunus dulcis]VVA24555.1 PREDICTED: trans-resveratrol [Prunus dulcis]